MLLGPLTAIKWRRPKMVPQRPQIAAGKRVEMRPYLPSGQCYELNDFSDLIAS
jgi:hypothetical protein